jgi:putative CocE/NonD family hydrolase
MTPYDNSGGRENARWFARRGYAVAQADVRGRYDSEGEWDPWSPAHRTDGYDLVEWLAAQPWSNGRVGMMGGSYLGWTQWWTASTAPPSLKAIAPLVSPPDPFENFPYQNGVLVGGYAQDWAAMMSGRTNQSVGQGVYGGWNVEWDTLFHTPYIEINRKRGMQSAPWFEQWYRQNKSTDPYWRGLSYQGGESWSKMTVPSLTGGSTPTTPGLP